WIEVGRPLEVMPCKLELPAPESDKGHTAVGVSIILIERDRPVRMRGCFVYGLRPIVQEVANAKLVSDPCVSVHVVWIQCGSALKVSQGLQHFTAVVAFPSPQEIVVGGQFLRRLPSSPFSIARCDPARQSCGDRACQFVLSGENILNLAIISLGPNMSLARSVDQLRCQANPVAGLSHATLDDIADAKRTAHRSDVDRGAAEPEGGIAGYHVQGVIARQLGDDVFGDSVAEIL